jgi:CRISPR/Cas system CMR subunit Cmr4 (Cas7 group RAMP superfamily)
MSNASDFCIWKNEDTLDVSLACCLTVGDGVMMAVPAPTSVELFVWQGTTLCCFRRHTT